MTPLQLVLTILQTAAGIVAPIVAGDATAANAEKIGEGLLSIVSAAATAYQAHTGKPIDLDALKPIDPVA